MKKMFSELETKGYEYVGANDGYIALYCGSCRCLGNLIGYYRVYSGNKGEYIRYNRTTYYFD